MDFKEGDEVVFIGDEDSHFGLEFGKIYTINYISKSNNQNVKINDDWVNGFSLADPENLKPWQAMRLLEGGEPVYSKRLREPYSVCNGIIRHGMRESKIFLSNFLNQSFVHKEAKTKARISVDGKVFELTMSQFSKLKSLLDD